MKNGRRKKKKKKKTNLCKKKKKQPSISRDSISLACKISSMDVRSRLFFFSLRRDAIVDHQSGPDDSHLRFGRFNLRAKRDIRRPTTRKEEAEDDPSPPPPPLPPQILKRKQFLARRTRKILLLLLLRFLLLHLPPNSTNPFFSSRSTWQLLDASSLFLARV